MAVLWLEREVVASLTAHTDARRRAAIADYVDGALHAMPEHLRLGVAAESLVLGLRPRLLSLVGRFDRRRARDAVHRWEGSRIGLIRQYPRLLSSLVLFADGELP
jgi:hypothetical protein